MSEITNNSTAANVFFNVTGDVMDSASHDHGPPYLKAYWIACEAVLCFLTLFSIYVFVNTIRYTLTKKSSPGRDLSGKQGRQLHLICITASGLAVLRILSDQAVAFLGFRDDDSCYITITVSTVFFSLSLLSVYIFLWMRQSIFYANPVLAKVLNRAITFLSWSTLVVMIMSGICLTVLYNLPSITGWVYKATEDGCKEISTDQLEMVPAITVATTIYFQLALLALFLYPLLSRKTQRYRSAGKATTVQSGSASINNSYSQHPSSVSNNTDDNLTDGDVTGATHSVQSPIIKSKTRPKEPTKCDDILESENESGVDVQGPSDKSSETSSSGAQNADNPAEWKRDSESLKGSLPNLAEPGETTKLKDPKQKRPSLLANTRFFKSGSLFYRRHQSKLSQVPQSPTAKRSRAKTVATISMKLENEDSEKERKMSSGSNKSERRKKLRRRAKRTQQGRRMMAYLKKVFYLMMVCVITDVIATVVQDVAEVPELVYLVVFDLSLMVNIICIILSFRDWDVILFPLCAKRSSGQNSTNFESSKASVRANVARNRTEVLRRVAANDAAMDYQSELNYPTSLRYQRQNNLGTFSAPEPLFNSPTISTAEQSTSPHILPPNPAKKDLSLNGKT